MIFNIFPRFFICSVDYAVNIWTFALRCNKVPDWEGWGLDSARIHTQYPSLSIITLQGTLQPSYRYLPIVNNNKVAFASISLGLWSGHLPSSVFHWIRPMSPPEGSTVVHPFSRWVKTHVSIIISIRDNRQTHLKIHLKPYWETSPQQPWSNAGPTRFFSYT